MPDVTALLKQQHREAIRLLDDLAESPERQRRRLLEQFEQAMNMHMQLEEEYLYPLVAEHLGDEEAESAEAEHELARHGLEMLREWQDKPGFGAVVEMVRAGVEHHVREEEREILPELKKSMDRDEWSSLGDEVEEAAGATTKRSGRRETAAASARAGSNGARSGSSSSRRRR